MLSVLRPSRLFIIASFLATFFLPAIAAEADSAVTAFVNRINATVSPIEPGDGASIRAACAKLVAQTFDFNAMAPAIADGAWSRMNGEQRSAYVQGLQRRAAADCASHGNEIAGNTVELVGVREGDGGDHLVAVRQSQGRGRTVIWQVRKTAAGSLRAVDMTVDGRSLAVSARRDASDVLNRTGGDVTALIRSVGG